MKGYNDFIRHCGCTAHPKIKSQVFALQCSSKDVNCSPPGEQQNEKFFFIHVLSVYIKCSQSPGCFLSLVFLLDLSICLLLMLLKP